MNFSRFPDDGPRDFEGARLTYNQVLQINDLLEKINSNRYSFNFVSEMRDLANQTFQRAYRKGDYDKIGEIGPELQVLNHVLNIAFSGGYKKPMIAPDAKHLQYLQSLEQEAIEAEEELEEQEEEQLEQPEQQSLFEAIEEDSFLQTLPPDVRADIDPISHIPQIATTQNKIRELINELRVAVEDGEPPFIIRNIEQQIARTHEKLVDQLNRQDLARRFFRYNPYY